MCISMDDVCIKVCILSLCDQGFALYISQCIQISCSTAASSCCAAAPRSPSPISPLSLNLTSKVSITFFFFTSSHHAKLNYFFPIFPLFDFFPVHCLFWHTSTIPLKHPLCPRCIIVPTLHFIQCDHVSFRQTSHDLCPKTQN